MSTPATDDVSPTPGSSAPTPAFDAALAEKLIGAWHRLYLTFKPIEVKLEAVRAKVDAARAKIVKLLVDAGVESFVSKHGKVSLQRRHTINWEQLARDTLKPEFVEKLVAMYTTTSAPFTRAPQSWSGESKA